MEIVLNLVWLIVCALAVADWWRHTKDIRFIGPGIDRLQLLALGCALLVLFPAISASDDIYAVQFNTDSADSKKISKGPIHAGAAGHCVHRSSVQAVTESALSRFDLELIDVVGDTLLVLLQTLSCTTLLSRPPPSYWQMSSR
jgi:hypothetical protein